MALTLWKNSDGKLIKNDSNKLIKCESCPCGTTVDGDFYLRVNYSVAQPPAYWSYSISGSISSPINVPITFDPRNDSSVVWGETTHIMLDESIVYTGFINAALTNTSPNPDYNMSGSVTVDLYKKNSNLSSFTFELETDGSATSSVNVSFQIAHAAGSWGLKRIS